MRFRWLVLLGLALGASASAQRLPQLAGLPLWPTPEREAPAEVRRALGAHREARALRLRRAPADATSHASWSRETMQPWLAGMRDALQELERTLARPDAPPTWRLLAAILVGDLSEHLGQSLLSMAPPDSIAQDPELRAVFERSLQSYADPVLERAARAYDACDPLAAATPAPLDAWAPRCRERAQAIRALLASRTPPPPPTPPLRGSDATPSVCTPALPRRVDEAPPADLSAPLEIAVTYVGSELARGDAARVVTEVERALTRRGLTLVPAAQRRRAEGMVAQRRWRPRGPVCALPPSLASVLAPEHPNLALAEVRASCSVSRCTLEVDFRRPVGAETTAGPPLPPRFQAHIDRPAPRRADWIAAARGLERRPMVLGIIAASGTGTLSDVLVDSSTLGSSALMGLAATGPRAVQVAGVTPNDPVLAPAARLMASERALRACFVGQGTVALHVRVELDERGAVRASEVSTVEGTATGSDAALENLRACVQRAIAATPFPCPAEATSFEAHVCLHRSPGYGGLGVRR